jgi:hypothetical protein
MLTMLRACTSTPLRYSRVHTLLSRRVLQPPSIRFTRFFVMPASGSKRKAVAHDSDNETTQAIKKAKSTAKGKSKATSANENDTVANSSSTEAPLALNGQPTNKGLPSSISFPPKLPDTIRISAWNICGLAAASKKVLSSVTCSTFVPMC